jgi:hypothetical protein
MDAAERFAILNNVDMKVYENRYPIDQRPCVEYHILAIASTCSLHKW